MKNYFQIEKHCDSKYSNKNTNILSRIQNTVAKAINEQVKLPQIMLFVLHRDIINSTKKEDVEGCTALMGEWMEWLMEEINGMVERRLSQLPDKAINDKEPTIYWATIPQSRHFSYSLRVIHAKFNNVLENIIKLYPRMCLIKMKTWWDTEDKAINFKLRFY